MTSLRSGRTTSGSPTSPYCSTWSGIVYVAFVIDVFSRRIVGWKAARTMHASLVLDALAMATWTRRGVALDELLRSALQSSVATSR